MKRIFHYIGFGVILVLIVLSILPQNYTENFPTSLKVILVVFAILSFFDDMLSIIPKSRNKTKIKKPEEQLSDTTLN